MTLRERTAESVTEGHPDKLCDLIADTILDAVLTADADAHAAVEVTCTGGECHVFGETTLIPPDVEALARGVYRRVGHPQPDIVRVTLDRQSPEIRAGVGSGVRQGAGDQGVMVGYACDETPQLMPLPVVLAHMLARRMDTLRHGGVLPMLGPDGKTQVTVLYGDDGPRAVTGVLVSAQHAPDAHVDMVRDLVERMVVRPVLADAASLLDVDVSGAHVTVNPAGAWTLGGPWADSGLTGRKLAVDQYGPSAPNGGGALSGKDPSKTDRSGAYMARLIARTVVASGLASRCTVTLAYMIGRADPVQVDVDTHGTGDVDDMLIRDGVLRLFDLTPHGIIRRLGLKRPMYAPTAVYGHYGRTDLDLPWESSAHADELRRLTLGPAA